MTFAPHTNDRRTIGEDPLVLGQFREKDTGNLFEFAERLPGMFPADFGTDCPHIIYVGPDQEKRLALVKKTVVYVVVDERPDGSASYERWDIKGHRLYDVAGL